MGDRRSRQACDSRSLPVCDERPSGAERRVLRQRGRGELDLDDVPELARSLLDDPSRCARMGAAMLATAKPDAADAIADELVALAGR